MATASINGVQICYELSGSEGVPLVLVHGSWDSHHDWDLVVPVLAESFRVLSYDRRGHSDSERPSGQGSVREDVSDLAALIGNLDLEPAWVAGNSFGASIALRLAAQHPELLPGVIAHEPPLFSLLADDPSVAPMLDQVRERGVGISRRGSHPPCHASAALRRSDQGVHSQEAGRMRVEPVTAVSDMVFSQRPEALSRGHISHCQLRVEGE